MTMEIPMVFFDTFHELSCVELGSWGEVSGVVQNVTCPSRYLSKSSLKPKKKQQTCRILTHCELLISKSASELMVRCWTNSRQVENFFQHQISLTVCFNPFRERQGVRTHQRISGGVFLQAFFQSWFCQEKQEHNDMRLVNPSHKNCHLTIYNYLIISSIMPFFINLMIWLKLGL